MDASEIAASLRELKSQLADVQSALANIACHLRHDRLDSSQRRHGFFHVSGGILCGRDVNLAIHEDIVMYPAHAGRDFVVAFNEYFEAILREHSEIGSIEQLMEAYSQEFRSLLGDGEYARVRALAVNSKAMTCSDVDLAPWKYYEKCPDKARTFLFDALLRGLVLEHVQGVVEIGSEKVMVRLSCEALRITDVLEQIFAVVDRLFAFFRVPKDHLQGHRVRVYPAVRNYRLSLKEVSQDTDGLLHCIARSSTVSPVDSRLEKEAWAAMPSKDRATVCEAAREHDFLSAWKLKSLNFTGTEENRNTQRSGQKSRAARTDAMNSTP